MNEKGCLATGSLSHLRPDQPRSRAKNRFTRTVKHSIRGSAEQDIGQ